MEPDLLLVTCSDRPAGEPGHAALDQALSEVGVSARWVCWDDARVDWASALVAVRSAWDYDARLPEFMAWARSVPRMLNGADAFEWNTDKCYLAELAAAGLPTVPTAIADLSADLRDPVAEFAPAVVKPRVGAGGRGVHVVETPADLSVDRLGPGPWVVQPLVDSVRTEGETSVFVLDGDPVSMVRKLPAGGQILVHEQYGGTTIAVVPTAEATDLARHAVAIAERILGTPLDYARVDQMRLADGRLAVSELEITEPGLYLEELPDNGRAFAAMIARRLQRG